MDIDRINLQINFWSMSIAHPLPTRCPVCDQGLHVTRVACPGCHTAMEGRFTLGRFAALSREQWAFLEAFVASRGKIKDVEQALGVSYPTVVARLDELLAALGLGSGSPRPDSARQRTEILDALAAGKMDPETAAQKLRALS